MTGNLYDTTLNSLKEGFQLISFDWRYLDVNDAVVKQGKYPREELIGYTMMEKYPGIDKTPMFDKLHQCMEERTPQRIENEFTFPDGSAGWFELTIRPVPEGIFILSMDITDRKAAEEKIRMLNEELEQKVIERTAELESSLNKLKENEDKFEKAFRASAAAISITRLSDATYTEVNESFIKLTGFSKEELIGHGSIELGLVMDMKKREDTLATLKKKGSIKDLELTIKNKKGEVMTALTSIETILVNGEKYAINILYDITERKHAEEQLEAVNKELESFSYSVSHDLRAPLRAVNGYAQMLDEDYTGVLDAEGKRIIEAIKYNATKMGTLIDDLLSFSRLGRKEIQKSEIDMNQLMEGVMMDISRSITHKAKISIGQLNPITGDYGLIQQVMFNLLANAIKYSSKKEEPAIEISSKEENKEIIYSVKDNGVGFDMQYAHKLFGVFQRLHKANDFEGTGVGLATVQRIVNKQGGRVWAEAALNKGATFYFSLPNP